MKVSFEDYSLLRSSMISLFLVIFFALGRADPAYDSFAEWLFKQDVSADELRKFNVIISDEDFAELNASPAAEEYVPCSLEVKYLTDEVQRYDGIGCRYKGSIGTWSECTDLQGHSTYGTEACRKLSWKTHSNKFCTVRKGDEACEGRGPLIEGFEKFQFMGMMTEPTRLTGERYTYNWLNEKLGVKAPRAVHMELYINGESDGLYLLLENPDEFAMESLFGSQGILYKEVWPWQDQGAEYYDERQKHGDSKAELFRNLYIEARDCRASGDACTQEAAAAILDNYLVKDSWIRGLAGIDITGNWDQFIAIHDIEADATLDFDINHNYYIYISPDDERLVYVPWDQQHNYMDACRYNSGTNAWAGGVNEDKLNRMCVSLPWWLTEMDFESVCKSQTITREAFNISPLGCDDFGWLIAKGWYDEYKVWLSDWLADLPDQVVEMRETLEMYRDQIDDLVRADPGPFPYEDWEPVDSAVMYFEYQSQSLHGMLSGTDWPEGFRDGCVSDVEQCANQYMDLADGCSENAELCGCECVGRPVIDCWPEVDCASEQDIDTSSLICCDTDSSLCDVAQVPGPREDMDCPSAWKLLQDALGLTSCLEQLANYCPVTCGSCPAAESTSKADEDSEELIEEEDQSTPEPSVNDVDKFTPEPGVNDVDESIEEVGFDNDYSAVMSSYDSVDAFLAECTRAVRSIRSSCACDSVTQHPQTQVITITLKGQSESVNAVASQCRESGLELNYVQLDPHIDPANRESSAFGLISSTAIFVVLLGCL